MLALEACKGHLVGLIVFIAKVHMLAAIAGGRAFIAAIDGILVDIAVLLPLGRSAPGQLPPMCFL